MYQASQELSHPVNRTENNKNRPKRQNLLPDTLLGPQNIINEASPKLTYDTGLRSTIFFALELLTGTRAADGLGQRERVKVDGVVIDDLAHRAGLDVGAGAAGHGVDLGLHGWGARRLEPCGGPGKDRDLDGALQRGGIELCHAGHVDEVDG